MRVFIVICALMLCYAPAAAQDARLAARRTPVVAVFEQCKDAVVNIATTQIIQYRSPFGFGDLFDNLMPPSPGRSPGLSPGRTRVRRVTSVGSGFVFHKSGYIVTNAHVVARTAERKAIFADGSEYDAKIIAIDEARDLAVLKVQADHDLPTIHMGISDDLMVGETVIAIGNPMGFKNTVTAGIVSALDRSIQVSEKAKFEGLIQTDASINPGNSGGPLLNVLGELIGINTAIRSDAQNIGFAIPVNQLRNALPELLDIERRYRIVVGMHVSPDARRRVVAVDSNTPAADAGIQVGDVIESIDGHRIVTGIDYQIAMLGRKAGDRVPFRVRRDGDRVRPAVLELVGRPRPDGAALLQQRIGIKAAPLTDDVARKMRLPVRIRGLVVTDIASGSPADKAGLRRGDIVTGLGRYQIASLDEAGQLLENVRAGDRISVDVLRPTRRNLILRQRITLTAR